MAGATVAKKKCQDANSLERESRKEGCLVRGLGAQRGVWREYAHERGHREICYIEGVCSNK